MRKCVFRLHYLVTFIVFFFTEVLDAPCVYDGASCGDEVKSAVREPVKKPVRNPVRKSPENREKIRKKTHEKSRRDSHEKVVRK